MIINRGYPMAFSFFDYIQVAPGKVYLNPNTTLFHDLQMQHPIQHNNHFFLMRMALAETGLLGIFRQDGKAHGDPVVLEKIGMIAFCAGKIQGGEIAFRSTFLLHHRNQIAERNALLPTAPKRFEEHAGAREILFIDHQSNRFGYTIS